MRDNETIISVCDQLSKAIRESLIELIKAGASPDVMHPMLRLLHDMENVPRELAEPYRRHEPPYPEENTLNVPSPTHTAVGFIGYDRCIEP